MNGANSLHGRDECDGGESRECARDDRKKKKRRFSPFPGEGFLQRGGEVFVGRHIEDHIGDALDEGGGAARPEASYSLRGVDIPRNRDHGRVRRVRSAVLESYFDDDEGGEEGGGEEGAHEGGRGLLEESALRRRRMSGRSLC